MIFLDIAEKIRWRPLPGDPTFTGWLIFASYIAAAFLCVKCIRVKNYNNIGSDERRQRIFWRGLSFVLIALAINKQLDLHTLFTDIIRAISLTQGWYESRRTLQLWFIAGFAVSSALLLSFFVLYFRSIIKENVFAIVGVFLIGLFILIRAASFEHADTFLGLNFHRLPAIWILELSGITFIGISALKFMRNNN